jgi:hypothetical protein
MATKRMLLGPWLAAVSRVKLKQSTRAVVAALAGHMDYFTLECHPSIPTLGREATSTRPTVRKALRELIDSGLLGVDGEFGKFEGGAGKTYHFRGLIPTEKGARTAPVPAGGKGARTAPVPEEKGSPTRSKRGRVPLQKGSPTRPRTSSGPVHEHVEEQEQLLAPAAPSAPARLAEEDEALAALDEDPVLVAQRESDERAYAERRTWCEENGVEIPSGSYGIRCTSRGFFVFTPEDLSWEDEA